jgi:exodeoxyribonuclease V alpha subunit
VSYSSGVSSVEVEYESGELDEVVLAYAVSVHKAQGSEFSCVVMPLVTRHYMLLQRHLLYTAISRARRLCVLVGSERALSIAVGAHRRDARNTRLATRIKDPEKVAQLELV